MPIPLQRLSPSLQQFTSHGDPFSDPTFYCSVDPALLRPDEMIMILNLYLVNRFQDQDQETNESVLQSTDPVH
ncbi:hypothetical protein OSB04_001619 [Centaurea solstitialis]|uniref:Uncharacterized protein n=1 Tax=Centaurea solstitialis TaxID=347529 RepID=A0AA38TYV2_9ASTR|nr:hypothetical protein OSB04_001619 [Centaurea solstitialis]